MPLSPQRIAELDQYYAQQPDVSGIPVAPKPPPFPGDSPADALPPPSLADTAGVLQSAGKLQKTTLTPQRMAQLDQFFAKNPPKGSESTGYIQPFIDTAKQGLGDAADFMTMNYGKNRQMRDALHGKMKAGTADRHDYERAFMEAVGDNPAGKALGAAAGLIPEFNVVTTAFNKWINPAISNATGIDPTELQMAEMAAAPIAGLAAKSLPMSDAVISASKGATYPVRHPINTAGTVIGTGAKVAGAVAKPVVQPIVRGILEGDNPITGEPGLKNALASDTATEGARLGKKMGVDFSAGELTGNPTAMGIEDALANSARWGGKFAEANQKKVDAVVGNFQKTLDKIYPESTTRTDVGDRLTAAYNGTLNNLVKTRGAQAKIDFDSALKGDEGNAVILSNNLFKELQAIKSEGDAKLLTKSKAHAASLAGRLLNRVSTKTQNGNVQADSISLQDMANGLSDFSAEASRPGSILDNAQTAAERRVYARLFGALQSDLDAEIATPKGNAARAAQLAVARDNFRNLSGQISDVQKTALGKVVGNAEHDSQGNLVVSPEKMADKFAGMEPTEIRNVLGFLDKSHPDVAQMVRRHTLERALSKAQEGKGQRGQGTTKEFAKADFVKNLPDDAKLNALLKDRGAANDVQDVAAAMNRMIDYGAQRKGSHTAQRTDFLASIAKWGKGALYRSLVSDSLAEDLLNPAKRRQIAIDARSMKAGAGNAFKGSSPTRITIRPNP